MGQKFGVANANSRLVPQDSASSEGQGAVQQPVQQEGEVEKEPVGQRQELVEPAAQAVPDLRGQALGLAGQVVAQQGQVAGVLFAHAVDLQAHALA
jgi:hypothetical protein